MEGNPADLTIYTDTDTAHDHTYIGNGCSDGDGSITPCESRIVQTADSEAQKNGTYYHFQAATSGTGGGVTTDKAIVPDTFCPLGWQLPYGGTGGDYDNKSRSWAKLFNTYSIAFSDGTTTDATKIKSYPFSYVYSGRYRWNKGLLYYQTRSGNFWSSTVASNTDVHNLGTWSSAIKPDSTDNKTMGYALRYALIISVLTIIKIQLILKS